MNLILGQFHLGFTNQPIAHNDIVWNFSKYGSLWFGICISWRVSRKTNQHLAEKEIVMLEIFVIGMIVGAAFSHNFALASSGAGVSVFGPYMVIIGLVFCLILGFCKER